MKKYTKHSSYLTCLCHQSALLTHCCGFYCGHIVDCLQQSVVIRTCQKPFCTLKVNLSTCFVVTEWAPYIVWMIDTAKKGQ